MENVSARAFFPMTNTFHVLRPLKLNASPIPVQMVESRRAPTSYAVLKKFYRPAWRIF